MHRGSRVRSPPVPVVLSAYQRGSLLDGLAMHLSCDTKKSHDNESTDIIFGRPPIGGKLPPSPWRCHWMSRYIWDRCRRRVSRSPVLDCGTTFHLDYGGRDLPSTLSDNLGNLIYLETAALSDSFEFIGAI